MNKFLRHFTITMSDHFRFRNSGYITAFGNGWSLICWKWRNTDGKTELYKDGKLLMSLTGFQTGYTIPGGGIFILGHELDSHGGGFQANQALTGLYRSILFV